MCRDVQRCALMCRDVRALIKRFSQQPLIRGTSFPRWSFSFCLLCLSLKYQANCNVQKIRRHFYLPVWGSATCGAGVVEECFSLLHFAWCRGWDFTRLCCFLEAQGRVSVMVAKVGSMLSACACSSSFFCRSDRLLVEFGRLSSARDHGRRPAAGLLHLHGRCHCQHQTLHDRSQAMMSNNKPFGVGSQSMRGHTCLAVGIRTWACWYVLSRISRIMLGFFGVVIRHQPETGSETGMETWVFRNRSEKRVRKGVAETGKTQKGVQNGCEKG